MYKFILSLVVILGILTNISCSHKNGKKTSKNINDRVLLIENNVSLPYHIYEVTVCGTLGDKLIYHDSSYHINEVDTVQLRIDLLNRLYIDKLSISQNKYILKD